MFYLLPPSCLGSTKTGRTILFFRVMAPKREESLVSGSGIRDQWYLFFYFLFWLPQLVFFPLLRPSFQHWLCPGSWNGCCGSIPRNWWLVRALVHFTSLSLVHRIGLNGTGRLKCSVVGAVADKGTPAKSSRQSRKRTMMGSCRSITRLRTTMARRKRQPCAG